MELMKQHILPYLNSFLTDKSNIQNDLLNEIENDLKTEFVEVIRYFNNILDETFPSNNNGLATLHIHIEDEFNESQKLLLVEFLIIKSFTYYNSIDKNTNETNLSLIELITTIGTKLNALEMRCPDGASGKNGGNRIWKNWVKDKKENRTILEFYKGLNESASLKPKSIINTQKNFCSSVSRIFEFKPYCILLDSKNKSYNLLNTTKTLNDIDAVNKEIIDELDSIVLFDCERKSVMSNFSFEEINKWNSDYDTSFNQYLIITFGKEYPSINNVRNKLELIKERFKIPTNTTYTVIKSEIDSLLRRKSKSSPSIEFVGYESSSFWDTFVLETSIRELYELRSIKLINIYSICYNEEIKGYIIEELFSKKEFSELISSSTKMAILELREDDIEILKEALSNTLDLIINSDIKSKIIEILSYTPIIIFDEAIIRNAKLLSKITICLALSKSIKLKTWSDLLNFNSNYFLFLSYRDQGKYPNYYYPNLLEMEYPLSVTAQVILHYFLFGQRYKWSIYYLLKEYHTYLNHPIRQKHFEWNHLKGIVQKLKPEFKIKIDWDLEYEFSGSNQRESYRVKVIDQKIKTFNGSDLVIFSDQNEDIPRIERVKWLFENLDIEENKYKIQKLDDLLYDFNPADKLIDTSQQDKELEVIRKQLGLEGESAGRIWKVLLKKESENRGVLTLYEDLNTLFKKNDIPLVSFFHFQNSWIKIDSDSLMPRGNKVFRVLCEFLGLKNNYRLIIYNIKNTSINGKAEATKKYSRLLKDLFYHGCFDDNVFTKMKLQTQIEYYKSNHVLDELGINNENPLPGLFALVELVRPEIQLIELISIEKLSNE